MCSMCSDTTMASMDRTMLIVDDHAGYRRQARAMFTSGGYEVVGEAEDVASGVRAAAELRPPGGCSAPTYPRRSS
jgi:AmiR/NasT family two-component response regulator